MQYQKPLIFIYPISDTLKNLKKAIEASGQPLEIYEIEDLRELLQTVPALGQSLVLGSNAKKCAKFLQAAKKIIKQYDTKVVIISQKQYPRKTVDKLMKFGLNDIIFEPVPAKTLMYKVNLMLRSLKVPSKQELEKKFKAEQAAKAQEDGDDFNLKEGESDLSTDDDDDSKEFKKEESEEELLDSLNNQKVNRNENQLADDSFDARGVDSGNSEMKVEKSSYNEDGEEDEEDEEDLLASMQKQQIKNTNEDSDHSFDARGVDSGNSEMKVEKSMYDEDGEEDEEDLLASMQKQKIQRPGEEEIDHSFDARGVNSGNSEMKVEKSMYENDGDEEIDEDSLLSNMPSSDSLKREDQDTNFDANSLNVPAGEQTSTFSASDVDDLNNETEEDFDPYAQNDDGDDDEEMISLDDLATQADNSATNIDGEKESYETHMEGKGSTEHIEDDEHEMSDNEMEFAEMAALSEISNMSTKMKGEAGAEDAIDDNMMGDVHQQDKIDNNMAGDIYGQDDIDGNMQGDMHGQDEIEGNMQGDLHGQGEIDGNMQGDLYGEDQINSNMVGDISLDDLMEGGNLEGDVLSSLEDTGDLQGDVHSKEKNIKTYYDAEGINHQDQYDPNFEHSAENQNHGGHLEGSVYDSSDDLDDDMANLMADDVDLSDLMGESGVDEMGGHLEGDVYNTEQNPDGDFEGLISDDPQAERLKGRGGTDQIKENDLEGANNSLMGDQGGNMGGHQSGTEHIETHYNTDFAAQLDKKKKQNPMMEFDHEDDFYGQTEFAKAKKKSALDMHQSEDIYGQGHTNSLSKDKEKTATDEWGEQQADTGFSEFDDQRRNNPKMELPYELQEVEYDDEGHPIPKMQELDENGKPKNPQLQMQYEMETDWSKKSDGKLKAQYSLEELDHIDKQRAKLKVPQMSIDEQYAVYEDVDLDSLIDEFGSDDELGDEHLQELKDMAESLRESIYDDYEPESVTKLENFDPWDDDFQPKEREKQALPDPIDPKDALGLDTLIALSQIHQTVTMNPKDAIYQANKLLWVEHQCLACSFQIDGAQVTEVHNGITDPILSDEYLEPDAWNAIKTKLLQAHKKSSDAFWEGPDEEGLPKIYFRPYYEDGIFFGGSIYYFPKNIELERRGLFEAYSESLKMVTYSTLQPIHSLIVKQSKDENRGDKESIVGRVKGFYKETFVEEQVDQKTGKKGSKFGNWLKDKIEKIAS